MSTDITSCDRLLAGLAQEGYITPTSIDLTRRFMGAWKQPAYASLLMTEQLSEMELADALAKILGLPRLHNFESEFLAEEALPVLTFRKAREWECLPLRGQAGGVLLAMVDPTRTDRIDLIKQGLKGGITLAVGERSAIVKAIDELYPLSAQLPSLYGK